MASAGTAVLTTTNVGGGSGALMCQIAWVADASGNVNGNSLALPAGTVLKVKFVPSTTAVPTNLYDMDLLDAQGISQFDDGSGASIGANLSSTVPTDRAPFINGSATTYVRNWISGSAGGRPYQLTVSGAGSGGAGTVILYIVPLAV